MDFSLCYKHFISFCEYFSLPGFGWSVVIYASGLILLVSFGFCCLNIMEFGWEHRSQETVLNDECFAVGLLVGTIWGSGAYMVLYLSEQLSGWCRGLEYMVMVLQDCGLPLVLTIQDVSRFRIYLLACLSRYKKQGGPLAGYMYYIVRSAEYIP